jgi:predicted dehydrogenase
VLCEKPFAMNTREAGEMVEGFRRRGLFLGEALWTRFLPAVQFVRDALAADRIGRVVLADVNMICNIVYLDRLVNPEKGGSALLDLGVYALNFVDMFLGLQYSDIRTLCSRHATGVDDTEAVLLQDPDGALATCKISMSGCGNPKGVLYGTKGRIEVDDVMNFSRVAIYDGQNNLLDSFSLEAGRTGYEYEFLACRKAVLEGRREFAEMPLKATLGLMEQYDKLREAWGQ